MAPRPRFPGNGAAIDLWRHRVSVSGDTNWADREGIPGSGTGTDAATVTGLVANIGHTFQVRPRNSVGFGLAAGATAMPSVNLRLCGPDQAFRDRDALLLFCSLAFGPLLSETPVLL